MVKQTSHANTNTTKTRLAKLTRQTSLARQARLTLHNGEKPTQSTANKANPTKKPHNKRKEMHRNNTTPVALM